jgi:hypothetical protein
MRKSTDLILSYALLGAVITGVGVYGFFHKKKEDELYMLNNELYVYGHPGFEPSLKNARAKVAFARQLIKETAETKAEFESIIDFNQMS